MEYQGDTSVHYQYLQVTLTRFANPGGIKGEEGTPGYMAPEAIRRRGEDQAFDEKVSRPVSVHDGCACNIYIG